MRTKGILTGGRALTQWIQQNSTQGSLLQKIINGVNTLANNTASSAVGRLSPPPPIQGLNVVTGGEFAHITITHHGAIQQGIHYFVEVANNPQFSGAHPIDYGTSRTRDSIHLPALDSNGDAQIWYARGYSQYPGSDPSSPVNFGGASPTAITHHWNDTLNVESFNRIRYFGGEWQSVWLGLWKDCCEV